MNYITDIKLLVDVLWRVNESSKKNSVVEKCDMLFRAIEILFDAYHFSSKNTSISTDEGKTSRFKKLTLKTISPADLREFLNSRIIKDLLYFRPLIMNDVILEENRYNPKNINDELRTLASNSHNELIETFNDNSDNYRKVKKLCSVLYMVRSNLSHYGKTNYGPDLEKTKRDKSVCEVVFPILTKLIDMYLDKPSQKLLLYGTLKQEGINNSILDGLSGTIKTVKVSGYIENDKGTMLSYYYLNLNSCKIDVELIQSELLPNRFDNIDKFEGNTYQRILVPYELNNQLGVAHIYGGKN